MSKIDLLRSLCYIFLEYEIVFVTRKCECYRKNGMLGGSALLIQILSLTQQQHAATSGDKDELIFIAGHFVVFG